MIDFDADAVAISEARERSTEAWTRLKDALGPNDYAPGSGAIERLALVDLESLYASATEAARIRPADFNERYSRVVASIGGVDRAANHILTAMDSGLTMTSERTRASLQTVADRVMTLVEDLDRLDRFSSTVLAQVRVGEQAEAFDSEIQVLRSKVREAASEFGIEGDQTDWGRYSHGEETRADRWRIAALASLVATFGLAIAAASRIIGSQARWEDVSLKALATSALASTSFYCITQSTQHRTEARFARRMALELVTLSLFVERLSSESRETILLEYGRRRFGGPVDAPTEVVNTALPLAELLRSFASKN